MANITQGKPSAIFVMRLSPRALYISHKSNSAFTLISVNISLKFNALSILLFKKVIFFDKMCQ